METINDAALNYLNETQGDCLVTTAFKAGVEFAQKWISVNDELPDKTCTVIVKNQSIPAILTTACFNQKDGKFYPHYFLRDKEVAYWRPIDIK